MTGTCTCGTTRRWIRSCHSGEVRDGSSCAALLCTALLCPLVPSPPLCHLLLHAQCTPALATLLRFGPSLLKPSLLDPRLCPSPVLQCCRVQAGHHHAEPAPARHHGGSGVGLPRPYTRLSGGCSSSREGEGEGEDAVFWRVL